MDGLSKQVFPPWRFEISLWKEKWNGSVEWNEKSSAGHRSRGILPPSPLCSSTTMNMYQIYGVRLWYRAVPPTHTHVHGPWFMPLVNQPLSRHQAPGMEKLFRVSSRIRADSSVTQFSTPWLILENQTFSIFDSIFAKRKKGNFLSYLVDRINIKHIMNYTLMNIFFSFSSKLRIRASPLSIRFRFIDRSIDRLEN